MITYDIYTKPGCKPCEETIKFLQENDVLYAEHVVGKSITRDEVLTLFPRATSTPVIVVDGVQITRQLMELMVKLEKVGKGVLNEQEKGLLKD